MKRLKPLLKKEMILFLIGMGIIVYSNWIMCAGMTCVLISVFLSAKKLK